MRHPAAAAEAAGDAAACGPTAAGRVNRCVAARRLTVEGIALGLAAAVAEVAAGMALTPDQATARSGDPPDM